MTCNSCPGLLAELQETVTIANQTVLDSNKADRIFQENRAKMEKSLDRQYRAGILPVAWTFRLPPYVHATLILLFAILAYPAYRGVILKQEATKLRAELNLEPSGARFKPELHAQKEQTPSSEPVVSPSLLYPVRVERDAEDRTINVAFRANKTFALLFSLPAEDFENYSVEISRQNQFISPPGEGSSKLISVHLQAEYFQEGNYYLRIFGERQRTKTKLTQYKLTISKSK
jgi:hypothetical protein